MKKASIKLVRKTSLVADPSYEVVQLVNCASFSLVPCNSSAPVFRVGDELTEPQAESIATDRRFEVTIGRAK